MKSWSVIALAGCLALTLVGCQEPIPKAALQISPQTLEFRQLQTRKFETRDEIAILAAVAGLLQDTGFNIDETEKSLGVIVASKDRDAVETGQVLGAILVAALIGVVPAIDEKQKMRCSVVTKPHGDPGHETATSVRVTFQRIVWNTQGKISKVEKLDDPKMYQEFFEKLSKAVFLEAEHI